jgi:hypothetical protein
MRFVEILVLLGVLGFAVYLVLSGTMRRREAASRWRVVTHTGEDGARCGGGPRRIAGAW